MARSVSALAKRGTQHASGASNNAAGREKFDAVDRFDARGTCLPRMTQFVAISDIRWECHIGSSKHAANQAGGNGKPRFRHGFAEKFSCHVAVQTKDACAAACGIAAEWERLYGPE